MHNIECYGLTFIARRDTNQDNFIIEKIGKDILKIVKPALTPTFKSYSVVINRVVLIIDINY